MPTDPGVLNAATGSDGAALVVLALMSASLGRYGKGKRGTGEAERCAESPTDDAFPAALLLRLSSLGVRACNKLLLEEDAAVPFESSARCWLVPLCFEDEEVLRCRALKDEAAAADAAEAGVAGRESGVEGLDPNNEPNEYECCCCCCIASLLLSLEPAARLSSSC